MKKLEFEGTVQKQRFVLALVCGLLPILCTLFGLLSCTWGENPVYILGSISDTYYSNHKIIMIGALILCTFFFATYQGYLGDRIFTILAAIGSLGVAAFPCASSFYNLDYVGLFSLPMNISNILHFIFAIMTFGSLALMTLTQFTKGSNKKKNIVYYVCGIIMILAMLSMIIFNFPYHMMVFEAVHLEAFAVAWFVKSGFSFKSNTIK